MARQQTARQQTEELPPRLAAVLIRLCRSAELNKTQAVKLPYLVDVIATHVLGGPITEGAHQAWDHGVVTSQAWHYLDKCDPASSSFRVEPLPFSEEQRIQVAEEARDTGLTPEQQTIVDFVAREFAHMFATELGFMTKAMNPTISSWPSSRPADTGPDAYDRMTAEYQDMAKLVASVSLDTLRRKSVPIESIEEIVA